MAIKVRITTTSNHGVVTLSRQAWRQLGVGNEAGHVSFGQRQVPVRLAKGSHDGRPTPLGVGKDVAEQLGLKTPSTLWITWDASSQRLRLGPAIGVFVWRSRNPDSSYFMGAATDMVRDFVRYARRRNMAAYAFSARDIDWQNQTVKGFVPSGRRWVAVKMPLPDVVYDRIPSRTIAVTQRVKGTKAQLQEVPGLFLFNPFFLDKWSTYKALAEHPQARRFLPATEVLTSTSQVARWMQRYSSVYIKPIRGSMGYGVTRVKRVPSGYLYHRTRTDGPDNTGVVDSLPKLLRRLPQVLPKRRLIIQRGLRLARYQGRPFDIRVILQKSPKGTWKCTSLCARVSPARSVVSNVAEGGTMVSVRAAIRYSLGPARARRVFRRVMGASRLIGEALETQLGHEFGELGIDMAVDTQGRVWLIEVNSKPGRETDARIRGIPPSIRRVVRYAAAKAGF